MGFIVLPVAWLSPESDTADIVIVGPLLLVILVLLVGGITLLFNSYHVVRREGLRIPTLLPAVFGVFLLGVLVAAVATVFDLVATSSFWNIALVFVLVVIPIAMLVIQLFGFTAYSLIYLPSPACTHLRRRGGRPRRRTRP